MFAAIERAIGDGSSASVSYVDFRLDHHIGRRSISVSLKLLDHLGLIEVEPGPRLVNVFRFSNRWRIIDEVEAERLAELAREVKLCRTFEKRLEPKPVTKPPKPMPCQSDGRATTHHAAAGAVTADDAVAGRRALSGTPHGRVA